MIDAEILAIIDRLVQPLNERMTGIDTKIDRVLQQGERIGVVEAKNHGFEARLTAVENCQDQQSAELAATRGKNQVIVWLLGSLFALVGAVGAAGITKLLGWGG